MLTLLATLAMASPENPIEGVPTCFPISDAIEVLVARGALVEKPVFVEEHTACVGQPVAPVPPTVPFEETGRDALQFVVDACAPATLGVATYEVLDRAGGWLVAPVATPLVFDFLVDLDPATDGYVRSSPNVVSDARAILFSQLAIGMRVWIPPGPNPFAETDPTMAQVNTASFQDKPLLEALLDIHGAHPPAPAAITLRLDEQRVDGLGRRQAHLQLLPPPVLEIEGATMDVATPETAMSPAPLVEQPSE